MRIAILIAGAAAICGCAGSSGTAAAPPNPDLAARYLAIIASRNAASDGLSGALADPNHTVDSVRPAAQKLLDADIKTNNDLLAFQSQVPSKMRQDVSSLRAAFSANENDLKKVVASKTMAELNVALAAAGQDSITFNGAATLLRTDLGLPPASVSAPLA